jgi:hypothetical protein
VEKTEMAPHLFFRFPRSTFRTGSLAFVAAVLVAQLLTSAILPTNAVHAQSVPLSSGCVALNGAVYDGVYSSSFAGRLSFIAGERISLTAAAPHTGIPTEIRFEINFATAQTADYPGTLVYRVPANSTFTTSWTLDNGTASWLVSCGLTGEPTSPAATPTPTDIPTSTPTDIPTSTPTHTPTHTPTSTATDVPTAAATAAIIPTATPCVGQGADHVDHASERGQERRCDHSTKTPKEKKHKHDR